MIETVSQISGAWCEVGAEVLRVARHDGLQFRAEATPRVAAQIAAKIADGMRGFVDGVVKHAGTVELGWVAEDETLARAVFLNPKTTPPAKPVPPSAGGEHYNSPPAEGGTGFAGGVVLPGTPGVLRVVLDESAPESVAVPEAAVAEEGLKRVVFLSVSPTQMERREVTLGVGDGAWVEVFGVAEGERVVVDGVYQLKAAAPSADGAAPRRTAGHFHTDGVYHEGAH